MASSSPKQPTHRVSAAQFFLGMLVSQAAVTLGLNTQYAGGAHLLDNTVSALLAMGLGVLMALPAWALQKRYPDEPLPGKAAPLLLSPLFYLGGRRQSGPVPDLPAGHRQP